LKEKRFVAYPSDEIKFAFMRTSSVDTPRGVRIARRSHAQRIDVIVAMAMATLGASKLLSGEAAGGGVTAEDFVLGPLYQYGPIEPTLVHWGDDDAWRRSL